MHMSKRKTTSQQTEISPLSGGKGGVSKPPVGGIELQAAAQDGSPYGVEAVLLLGGPQPQRHSLHLRHEGLALLLAASNQRIKRN